MHGAASFLLTLWHRRVAVALAVLLLLVAVMSAAVYYAFNLQRFALDQQQTILLGSDRFAPDNPAAVRVLVRNQSTGQPVGNANVVVRLAPKSGGASRTLFTGQTDDSGTVPVAFSLPRDTARDQLLTVETSSSAGHDRIEKPVTVQRSYRILVTTDKPLYQPGQTLHLRALALGALDRVPAGEQPLEFLIEDPKGNKIYRKTVSTSAFGVASADFVLADTVNSGTYKITAGLGDTQSEKSVTVKPYVLPKFKVSVETGRGYYLPGERVEGRVRSDYFFGKAVSQGDVTLKGVVYDVERAETINVRGKTDADGVYSFGFDLPNYFAGRGLDKDRADFGLEISVTDQANHTEQTSLVLPIANEAILIEAVPESGNLVPGVENIVYVLTSLPDGSPLQTTLRIDAGRVIETSTGKHGLAEVRLTPRGDTPLAITARDSSGRTATKTLTLKSETAPRQVLLRPDQATYRLGETMHLDLLTTGGVGTVYLDLVKEGQTLSTRAVETVNGKASVDVDVTPELVGTLQLHAYHIEMDSTIVRDTRVVVVEPTGGLNIAIKLDQDVYRPGDTSHVAFGVTNSEGKGVASALGVDAVDESVFALAEQDPGFAKLYFLLQKELLEPKYQVKGLRLEEVISEAAPADVRREQDQSARAAWAGAPAADSALRVDSQVEKRAATARAQVDTLNGLALWLTFFLSVIPLLVIVLIAVGLHAKKILGRSLTLWLGGLMAYCVFSPFFVASIAAVGGMLMEARLGVLVVALIAVAWLTGLGILAGHAVVKRDGLLGFTVALVAAYFVLLGLLSYTAARATTFTQGPLFFLIITYLGALASLVLLGVGLLVQRQTAPGLASILLALLFIPATVLLALMPSVGPLLRVMGSPGLYVPPALLTGCAPAMNRGAPGSGNLFRDLQSGLKMEAPPPVPAVAPTQAPSAGQAGEPAPAPRLRQFFPETLYFNPQVITDENGRAAVDIPLADSITTWRLAATASSQRGDLGATTAGVRVFQDFFVDLDLPVALTQNDEISVPVAVYNYLAEPQQVQLEVEQQPWFALQDDAVKRLTIASNDVDIVYFRIKAVHFGQQKLKVTALGSKMSDAIQREIRVYPDGKPFQITRSNWLKGGDEQVVEIPPRAVPGASRIEVKIYPGIMSQALDGLDGLLHVPYG